MKGQGLEETITKLYDYVIQYGMDIIGAVIIFVVGRLVAKFLAQLAADSMHKASMEKTLILFARHLIFYAVMTFACIAALNKLGVETSSFIAVIGAASLAVGLALQGSLANFASGVLIVLFQPFKVGDVIDAGGAQGKVEEIQIFCTIITSTDNKRVIVPNSKITGDKITIDVETPLS
jgi:small conductance mechanosensitive channel